MSRKKSDPGSPFSALAGLKSKLADQEKESKARAEAEKAARVAAASKKVEIRRDEDVFLDAMRGVKPIDRDDLRVRPAIKTQAPFIDDENDDSDVAVMRWLADVVAGEAPLDFSFSDEYVEGRHDDCPRINLMKLKAGEFASEATIDLHGHNRDEAKVALLKFFAESLKRSRRCVVVITGRGLRSAGGKPVLKELLLRWFAVGALSRYVLAFCSAKVHDGGVGALYVLLRKRPVL